MMESKVSIERFSQGARRPRVALQACPHCGGNVRKIRDIYGAYLQCLQCSREIQPAALTATSHEGLAIRPAERESEELMIA
ncbi:MAG: hypothetical protein OXI54_02015 [Chloroflexota bacterium]|nr:hypothetical protein [Chloroflexota bacterium]MDE2682912.1 hypothetical protein [Chloroflexota bacterium]